MTKLEKFQFLLEKVQKAGFPAKNEDKKKEYSPMESLWRTQNTVEQAIPVGRDRIRESTQ